MSARLLFMRTRARALRGWVDAYEASPRTVVGCAAVTTSIAMLGGARFICERECQRSTPWSLAFQEECILFGAAIPLYTGLFTTGLVAAGPKVLYAVPFMVAFATVPALTVGGAYLCARHRRVQG